MTKLLEKYLEFTNKNKEKLQKATSSEAYDCETYFDCFYDGANNAIHLHYDVGCETEIDLWHPEELDEYQSKLDDCVNELNEEY